MLPFTILDCRAPLSLLRQRIAQRRSAGGDASEADEGVLDRLRDVDEALDDDEATHALVIDAAQPLEPAEVARAWLARGNVP